ncbi:MAG: phosphoribosylamine--glycine ligase [Bacteroidota bacterium]
MKILVVGSGGREHAIVWKLRQSPGIHEIFCAPGNPGIGNLATNVPVQPTEIGALLKFAKKESIDLTVVGPEGPLVAGMVDLFEESGLKIFGPSRMAARLEGSKVFAKNFMAKYKIPTAKFLAFSSNDRKKAEDAVKQFSLPLVVKADGLAAGKGVMICETLPQALDALAECFDKKAFGAAGNQVVLEEFLHGEEASIFVLADGKKFALLSSAQDHKRILDGDLGKNTGGMGAYSPAPVVTEELRQQIIREIVQPTLTGMAREGAPYRGCLYVGLMITEQGPNVLEYNCRFGDPETQVVVPLIDGDLASILLSVADRSLDPAVVKIHPASAVCVVMASHGYPDSYPTGRKITGIESVASEDGVVVFHAGTKMEKNELVTAGGRVLGVTAIGRRHELEGTIRTAYRAVEKITFDGAYYRSDIAKKALKYLRNAS